MRGVQELLDVQLQQSLLDTYSRKLRENRPKGHVHSYRNKLIPWKVRNAIVCVLGNRERVLGNRERVLGNRECVLGNRELVLGNRECVLGNRECVLGNRERVLGNRECVVGNRLRLCVMCVPHEFLPLGWLP